MNIQPQSSTPNSATQTGRWLESHSNLHDAKRDNIAGKLAEQLIQSINPQAIEKAKWGDLTNDQQDRLFDSLNRICKEGQNCLENLDIENEKVQDYVKSKLGSVASMLFDTLGSQPNPIAEAGMSEAVISHKGSYRPILTTHSLATCIGVAGYDPINHFGFVIHFAHGDEIKTSGDNLLNRILAYREENINAPLLIHLRGGVQGWSESLLEEVKQWLTSNKLNSIIASEDTLQRPIDLGSGLPEIPASLKLDVRTGVCETYNASTNPYSKKRLKDLEKSDLEDVLDKHMKEKHAIKIVYDSKANQD